MYATLVILYSTIHGIWASALAFSERHLVSGLMRLGADLFSQKNEDRKKKFNTAPRMGRTKRRKREKSHAGWYLGKA